MTLARGLETAGHSAVRTLLEYLLMTCGMSSRPEDDGGVDAANFLSYSGVTGVHSDVRVTSLACFLALKPLRQFWVVLDAHIAFDALFLVNCVSFYC